MIKTGAEHRQRVADFRKRLTDFAQGKVPKDDRPKIDTTGSRSRAVASRSDIERIALYGRRRLMSIARVLALFEILRELEQLASRPKQVEVEAQGALWQAFAGTVDEPACHTCPALLMLDGHYPTLLTANMGLRRHIVLEFAGCMRMPILINKVDRQFDDQAGWRAFEEAADLVLNRAGTPWSQGVETYRGEMRGMFPEMFAIVERDLVYSDPELNHLMDACKSFYDGLFLTAVNAAEMRSFVAEVRTEMGVP